MIYRLFGRANFLGSPCICLWSATSTKVLYEKSCNA